MLTPYLERLIQEGRAEFREYVIGGSGVGTIPVQSNQKVVITDFTWFPFCDQQPIVSDARLNYFPIISIVYTPGPEPPNFNVNDIVTGASALNTGIIYNIDLADNIILVEVTGGDWFGETEVQDITTSDSALIVSITANPIVPIEGMVDTNTLATAQIDTDTPSGHAGYSPGQLALSSIVGSFNTDDLLVTTISFANLVQNGALIPGTVSVAATIQAAIANSVHHLRFRSNTTEATFNFRDTINGTILSESEEGETIDGYALPDPTVVNTYIWFRETVQIDIWKFSPSGNVFTQALPPPGSNEPPVPNGYSNAVLNPPVEFIATGQGANIVSLGTFRQPGVNLPRLKNEFIDDIGDLTELAAPSTNQSFPMVNISYVVINKPGQERG